MNGVVWDNALAYSILLSLCSVCLPNKWHLKGAMCAASVGPQKPIIFV
ncbi:hypothetical protein DCCM_4085 [Desulfocucumis palustris]|uniref:Uncharacterized protein n=1 Tax=Desulfocucumis palustris TaxID=1898651 RepID=A0A2L2XG43_9FIRM|nr:hypothetical protein DCCM_4085 [Desulfocucumis palustris]